MRLLDIVTSPWALMPEKLLEIRAIYETHLRGEKIDIKAVEARLGQPLVNEAKPYQVMDGVAVVPVVGVLAKRANLFMQVSGGTSTQIIGNWLAEAAADPAVSAIVLEIDSPGGQVDGVQVLAQRIADIRAQGKPVVAWVSGMAASGGYWLASAADRVVMADNTTVVGSIGVVATHVDVSAREAAAGVKTTEITAGKYKRIASNYGPLTSEGRATLQEQVDAIYSVFVEDVARHRGVSVEQVLNDMADGRVFIGQQAVQAGLVDGVSTLDALIAELQPRAGAARSDRNRPAAHAAQPNARTIMDLDTLKAEHPDLVKSVQAEAHAAGVQEGAAAERTRIAAIDAVALPAHGDLAAKAKAEGWDAGRYALAVLEHDKRAATDALASLKADAPAPAADSQPKEPAAQTIKRTEFSALSVQEQRERVKAGIKVVD